MANVGQKPAGSADYSDLIQTNHSDAFAFSDTEALALQLYDQLQEIELQRSLLEAQNEVNVPDVSALSDDVLQVQVIKAEREAMEAKAEYELRNKITENVLVMDPVIKAVHGGEDVGLAEKRISPLITESDTVSMLHGCLTSKLASTTQALGATEQKNMAANQANSELSKTLLALAEELKSQSTDDIEDPRLREKVNEAEQEMKRYRRRMRTLKGVVSGMIVGSGVDWAEDEVLRELVMDDEEDG